MELSTADNVTELQWLGDSVDVVATTAVDPWFASKTVRLISWSLGFGTVGTGTVTVSLRVNGFVVDTITSDQEYSGLVALDTTIVAGDKVEVYITDGGTGYKNIITQLFLEA